MCPSLIQIGSKTAEKNSAQTNKQTDRQTNRHYENNGHLAVNQLCDDERRLIASPSGYYVRPSNRADYYIFTLWFLLLSIFLSFFFPRLISAVADWMSAILPHMVWAECEFKMQV